MNETKFCKDCAYYEQDAYGHEFDRCLHGAYTKVNLNLVTGESKGYRNWSYCDIKRGTSKWVPLGKRISDAVKKNIDDGTSTLEPIHQPCGPEARFFVQRPIIITMQEHQTRWERFIDWVRGWL